MLMEYFELFAALLALASYDFCDIEIHRADNEHASKVTITFKNGTGMFSDSFLVSDDNDNNDVPYLRSAIMEINKRAMDALNLTM